jgi:polysaccharide deacetylase family sporulation protein PdaB
LIFFDRPSDIRIEYINDSLWVGSMDRDNKKLIILSIICIGLIGLGFFSNLYRNRVETGGKPAKKAIYSVDTEEKKVAISFDEGWGLDQTNEILDVLDKYNAKATFFLVGAWIETYPEDVKMIVERGHDLGNHTDTHQRMTKLSKEEKINEIMNVHNKVKELTGVEMILFRPPFGDYDDAVVEAAKECEYYTIKWNVDSLDWKHEGVDPIVDTVLNSEYLNNGSIILFHNNRKYTKDALDKVLEGLVADGYEIVSISDLIIKDNYYLDATGRQFSEEIN